MEITTTIGRILYRKGSSVWSITPGETVYSGLMLMAQHNIGALPVMSENRLVGMLSERDYARKVALLGRASKDTPVSQIMTRAVITVTREDSVSDSLTTMTTHRVRHLPVMEDGKLVGLISIGDLVNWTINAQKAVIHDLENYVTGAYPA
ncbi:MAG: CBS domain-containing protein [Chthoniobacterales bacterium]